jgi:hypothetical protein
MLICIIKTDLFGLMTVISGLPTDPSGGGGQKLHRLK